MVGGSLIVSYKSAALTDGFTSERTRKRLVAGLRSKGIADEKVLLAMGSIQRDLFVEDALKSRAYEDTALPIGYRQTISQPFVVALMSQILRSNRDKLGRVLEVGTGSGYQAAVLSRFADRVYTIERIQQLLDAAKLRLAPLGITNISFRHGDGTSGWTINAPFDGIILTAAPAVVPSNLFDQLADGGILVAPEGGEQNQTLVYWKKRHGHVRRFESVPVVFVPMMSGIIS
jgi:protein-L-isoaspartate(D-aspartate) O-methyltransferase